MGARNQCFNSNTSGFDASSNLRTTKRLYIEVVKQEIMAYGGTRDK